VAARAHSDNDDAGPLFDWYGNGDVLWSFPGGDDQSRSTQASADFMLRYYRNVAAVVIGRRDQPGNMPIPHRSPSLTASRRPLPPPRSSADGDADVDVNRRARCLTRSGNESIEPHPRCDLCRRR
jgi:hypothetical protein